MCVSRHTCDVLRAQDLDGAASMQLKTYAGPAGACSCRLRGKLIVARWFFCSDDECSRLLGKVGRHPGRNLGQGRSLAAAGRLLSASVLRFFSIHYVSLPLHWHGNISSSQVFLLSLLHFRVRFHLLRYKGRMHRMPLSL